jgi:cytochrome c556
MIRAIALLAGLTLAAPASIASPPPGPAQLIAARQAMLDMSAITFAYMREASKSGREVKTLAYPAQTLEKWATILPSLFPSGTGEGQTSARTQALTAVWRDRAGFERAAADYAEEAARLTELARADNGAGFADQLEEVNHACKACHTTYKEPDPPSR